jgi:hypothetical protein
MACGGLVGLGISAATLDPHDNSGGGGGFLGPGFGNSFRRAKTATILVLGMAAIGVAVGGVIGEDKVISAVENSSLETKKNLWKLRSKARMPDAR